MFIRARDSHPRSIAKAVSWRLLGSTEEECAIVCALRRARGFPLDDLTLVVTHFLPHLNRDAVYRILKAEGLGRLPPTSRPRKRFSSNYGSRHREVEDVDGLCVATLSTAPEQPGCIASDRHGIVLGPVRPKRAIRSRRWSGTGSRQSSPYRVRSSRPIWSSTCRSRGPGAGLIFVRVATIALHSLQGGSAPLSQPPAPTIRLPVVTLIWAFEGALASATRPISGKSPQVRCVLAKKGPYIWAALAKSEPHSR